MTAKNRSMRGVFTVVIFLLMRCGCCVANLYSTECVEQPMETIFMTPVGDRLSAQYLVKFCKSAAPRMKYWEVKVETIDLPREKCNNTYSLGASFGLHTNTHWVSNGILPANCSNVCVSVPVDMLYRQCYQVIAELSSEGTSKRTISRTPAIVYYADNDIPGPEYYHNHKIYRTDFPVEKDVMVFNWYLGVIPVSESTQFTVDAAAADENGTSTQLDANGDPIVVDVSSNCSVFAAAGGPVRCRLEWPGCAKLWLRIDAPWAQSVTLGNLSTIPDLICSNRVTVAVTASAEAFTWVWICAGAVVCAGGVAMAVLVMSHCRLQRSLKQRALHYWRAAFIASKEHAAPPAEDSSPRVLLIYARDCPHAMGVVQALTDLIEGVLPNSVIDLFSPETLEACAGGEAQWLRAVIKDHHTRVLVLHTPAMACLYRDRLARQMSQGDTVPMLEEPLLSTTSGAVYRVPTFGDSLCVAALRHVDTFATQHTAPYTKFFVAMIEGIDSSMVLPTLVPYRRYELPGGAPALLRDLAPPALSSAPPRHQGPLNTTALPFEETFQTTTLPQSDSFQNVADFDSPHTDNCFAESLQTTLPQNDSCQNEAYSDSPQNDNCLVESPLPLNDNCLTEANLPPRLRVHLESLSHHVTELKSYLREKPDYLVTELLIVP